MAQFEKVEGNPFTRAFAGNTNASAPDPAVSGDEDGSFEKVEGNPFVRSKQPNAAADLVKSTWTGIKEGVTALPGAVGDVENIWGRGVDAVASKAIGVLQDRFGRDVVPGAAYMGKDAPKDTAAPENYAHINGHPTGQELNDARQKITGPDYQPQTRAGRYARTAGNFATNALLPGGVGARIAAVAFPAFGSEASGEIAKGSKYEGAARVAGAVVGGGLAAAAAGPRAAVQAVPETQNVLQQNLARFDQAGVRPTMAAVGGPGAASLTKAMSENPLAGGRAREGLRASLDDTANAANRLSTAYGSNRGPQIAGENVQAGVNRFSNSKAIEPASVTAPAAASSFSAKADALYSKAFLPIETAEAQGVERARQRFEGDTASSQAEVAAENARRKAAYDQAVADENQRASLATARGGAKVEPRPIEPPKAATAADVMPQTPTVTPTATISTLRDMSGKVNAPHLSNMITDGRIKQILGAIEQDGHDVRFSDIRELRTWVRNAQRDPTLRQGIPQAGLQRIEQSLTQDIYSNAERLAGPQALRGLQRADQFYRAGMDRINRALQPFDDAGSGEGAYGRIVQAAGSGATADAQKLLSLKRSLSPDEWGDVAATTVKRLGQPLKGAEGAVDGDGFSVSRFVSNYASLSPTGREVLFGSLGGGGAKATELRAQLDNLVKVADLQKGVERASNASKSAVAGQTIATTGALLHPATTLPTVGVLSGMALTGEAMTNPAAVRALAGLTAASARGGQAFKSELGRLRVAAQKNAALMPIYDQAVRVQLPSATEKEPVYR